MLAGAGCQQVSLALNQQELRRECEGLTLPPCLACLTVDPIVALSPFLASAGGWCKCPSVVVPDTCSSCFIQITAESLREGTCQAKASQEVGCRCLEITFVFDTEVFAPIAAAFSPLPEPLIADSCRSHPAPHSSIFEKVPEEGKARGP